jgi:CBS domain-containing protein
MNNMLTKDFITKEFPVLKNFDTVEYALSVMDELKVKHLPVVVNETYQCLLSEKDLLAMDPASGIGEAVSFAPSISDSGHLHEIVARLARYQLSLLPVVSSEGKYIGTITRDRIFDELATLCHAEAPGSVVVLELTPQDYVLSDIARIIEANNAHVLSILSNTDKNTGRLLVTLKIDLEDASPVIRSFERFDYTVLYHFMRRGMVDEILQQRMDELIYYMSM